MFSPKDPVEIIALSFDFSKLNAVVSSASVVCTVVTGTDAAAASMVNGSAQISGAVVTQQIINGVTGCSYDLKCTAIMPDGTKYVLSDILAILTQ